ncbi:MAG: hypothetical protein IT328_00215 [Caldilineaceae bacterium]|nr:hypothetical protein [Caldilineaceae bacterium]
MSLQSAHFPPMMHIRLGIALLLALAGGFILSQPALAASDQPLDALALIVVNTTNPAINGGDGLCSIIEAVENANADAQIHTDCASGSNADTISLPADAPLIFTAAHNSIGGANALPVITGTVTIQGNGADLIRDTNAPNFRFFHVAEGGTLTLIDLGLRNGQVELSGTTQLLLGGGAIVNQGTLHIRDSNLSYNHASYGGAIYSQPVTGTLALSDTTFSYNIADLNGGALYNFGPATIDGGLLRFNQAAVSGGAVVHTSSTLTVTNATVQDNVTDGSGAGIAAYAVLTDSQVWIRATNLISNVAALNAGALLNSAGDGMTSVMEIEASSITANRASSTAFNEGIGGGVVNGWVLGGGGGVATMRLSQSLVADNVAQSGGGVANLDLTGYPTRTAEILISQSTLSDNTAAGVGSERGAGGGLFNSNGEATVVNSTVSGNQALGDDTVLGGRGGGIGNSGRGVTTTLQLLNSTIAFNEASQAGGGVAVLGPVTTTATSMEAGNTLIVSNVLTVSETISNAPVLATLASPQVIVGTESCSIENGTSNSLGGNIEDGATCGFDAAGDLTETSVPLGNLENNGGFTPTHLITEGGAAYNGGVDALCNAAPVNGIDQRGVIRPQQERCDVGAVELEVEQKNPVMYFPEIYLHFTFP